MQGGAGCGLVAFARFLSGVRHSFCCHSPYASCAPSRLQAQYTRQSGASPDYLFLLQRLMIDNPDAAVNLAKMVAKQVR